MRPRRSRMSPKRSSPVQVNLRACPSRPSSRSTRRSTPLSGTSRCPDFHFLAPPTIAFQTTGERATSAFSTGRSVGSSNRSSSTPRSACGPSSGRTAPWFRPTHRFPRGARKRGRRCAGPRPGLAHPCGAGGHPPCAPVGASRCGPPAVHNQRMGAAPAWVRQATSRSSLATPAMCISSSAPQGQLGTEFALALHRSGEQVVLADIQHPTLDTLRDLPYVCLDVRDNDVVAAELKRHGATHVPPPGRRTQRPRREGAAMGLGPQHRGLLNVLEVAAERKEIAQVFWPSSIAVFGPDNGPVADQNGHRLPETVYGISKQAGEQWCAWFKTHHGVDTRSVRYPGLIGELCPAGGGTTDYAVEVFDHLRGDAPPFLRENAVLPDAHGRRDPRRAADHLSRGRPHPQQGGLQYPGDVLRSGHPVCRDPSAHPPSVPNSRRTSGRPSPTAGPTGSTTQQPGRIGVGRLRSTCLNSCRAWSPQKRPHSLPKPASEGAVTPFCRTQ